ncbi:hypothetical protein BU26DRAFT_519559 [Trematosphaeria pertusa]|uniref:Uncharacterized protein n=1 Tax=Trematosphaeria pertusa TaxID=390896 RepID=A0A6A6IGI0_9PLEO|nr:uncharacterized protein BU26DRAFT_519559 [Trematosphaeria pertusa]KAF2249516.1 hypothetical protein BU26DRAFT_519559 [Trematosphaeria pertusa]
MPAFSKFGFDLTLIRLSSFPCCDAIDMPVSNDADARRELYGRLVGCDDYGLFVGSRASIARVLGLELLGANSRPAEVGVAGEVRDDEGDRRNRGSEAG